MNIMEDNLKIYRNEIDEIDAKIQELFLKRMEIAAKIANYKLENNYIVTDQNRELDIFNKIDNNRNKIIKMYYKNVQKALIEQSKAYQKNLIDTLKK